MRKSGLADSPLFKPSSENEITNSLAVSSPKKKKNSIEQKSTNRRKPVPPRYHDTMQPSNHATNQPTNHATMQPRHHATMQPRHHATMVETIRSALKEIGKEAATYRLTQEEKKAIEDLIYEYKRKHIKTSANEITRIGVNYILQDHKEKGKQSMLTLVIQALNR